MNSSRFGSDLVAVSFTACSVPAPERVAGPKPGHRAKAPAPTCTGRLAADYWLEVTRLEAEARTFRQVDTGTE